MEAQKQSKLIYQLEKEREKYSIEASEAAAKYMQALEEVKLREMAIIDLQKRISEGESKLKQQQNLYEAVRGEGGRWASATRSSCIPPPGLMLLDGTA
jgi:hypothetical protein